MNVNWEVLICKLGVSGGFCRAAALPGDYGGDRVHMRLSYSPLAPFILFLVEWMDYSCTDALPNYLGLIHILVYKVVVVLCSLLLPFLLLLRLILVLFLLQTCCFRLFFLS